MTASPPPPLPAYSLTLVIDAVRVVVTVYGQPSREDAEAMAEIMIRLHNILKDA